MISSNLGNPGRFTPGIWINPRPGQRDHERNSLSAECRHSQNNVQINYKNFLEVMEVLMEIDEKYVIKFVLTKFLDYKLGKFHNKIPLMKLTLRWLYKNI